MCLITATSCEQRIKLTCDGSVINQSPCPNPAATAALRLSDLCSMMLNPKAKLARRAKAPTGHARALQPLHNSYQIAMWALEQCGLTSRKRNLYRETIHKRRQQRFFSIRKEVNCTRYTMSSKIELFDRIPEPKITASVRG